jgi:signal transduction histidine kinase
MHMFDHGVLAAESPQAVAHMALGYLRDLIPCVRASVSVFDWQTGQASSLASHGTTELDRAAAYSLEMFGDTQQLGEGRVHLVEDMQALPRPLPHAAQVLYDFGVRSYMNVPLIVHGELIGCLNLGSGSPGSYLPEHVEIAREVADSLAIVIQNARLFDEVQAGRQRLQLLSHRLLEVQENERRHIARELHDEVGQTLTGLKLLLEMSSRLPADGIQCNLDEALGLVNQLAERVDELSLDLRPGMLDDLGLLPALLWHFEHYSKQTGVQVRFEHAGFESRRFEPDVETAAYRIVQEALTNVARHASVGQVEVRCMVARHMLSLQIRDEGAGFDPQAALASATSSGLSGIRERVALLEGQLTIDSAPHTGTRLTVELPLDGAE